MSLVGSEVEFGKKTDNGSPGRFGRKQRPSDPVVIPYDEEDAAVEDCHPPPTPPRPAESLFLGAELQTQSISAAALAQQIHFVHRSPSTSMVSLNTDDFCSVSEFPSDFGRTSISRNTTDDEADGITAYPSQQQSSIPESPFGNDALTRDLHSNPTNKSDKFQDTMTDTSSKNEFDAATHTYHAAKGIWSWGGVAGKVVEVVAGASLQTVDESVEHQLHNLDDGVLNPAVAAIVAVLLGAADKTKGVVDPIIQTLLKPLDMIKSKPENPELTTAPPAGVVKP